MFSVLRSPIAAAIIALAPACFVLWRGRALARFANDPALPERMLAETRARLVVIVFALAIVTGAWTRHAIWAVPVLVVARMAASYPLRKVLYEETWSLGAYLSFFLRLWVAVFGFWILLAAAPGVLALTGTGDWIAASLLAAVLLLWNARYSMLLRRMLGARPIDDARLIPRFARMVAACRLPPVQFERVDLRGGRFANAVALPAGRQRTVLFSETLLERLDDDEVAAICAHELAHLEHFNARRLRSLNLITQALIVTSVSLSPVTRRLLPVEDPLPLMIGCLWLLVLFVMLAVRAQRRQQHETASDLRAVALSGDADALIRALTKLHALSRLPRRYSVEAERQATHPSLARRIQAIRAAAGAPPLLLEAAVTLTATGGDGSATFHEDRLEWKERTGTTHTFSYSGVSELRLDVRSGAARLIVVDAAGHRWQLPLAAADIARAQAVMDVVDSRVAAIPAAPSALSPALGRFLALFVASVAMAVGHYAVAFIAALALIQPTGPLMGAAGAAAVVATVLVWHDLGSGSLYASAWMSGLAAQLAACAVMLIVVAFKNREERGSAVARRLVGVLAGCVVLAWCWILLPGVNIVRLHQGVREWPAATIFPFALAVTLAMAATRGGRSAAAALAVAVIVVMGIGSTRFLDAFSGDPFLAAAPPVVFGTMSGPPLAEFSTDLNVSDLRISPAGRSVALGTENDREETTFHVGRAGARLVPIDGDDAIFTDDDHLLLLGREAGAIVVREVAIDDGASIARQHRLTGIRDSPRLSFDSTTGAWTVVGRDRERDIVRATGRIGSETVDEQRWTRPSRRRLGGYAVTSSGADVLILETRYDRPLGDGAFGARWWWLLPTPHTTTVFSVLSSSGEVDFLQTGLDLNCSHRVAREPPVCSAFDGERTRLFAVDYRQRRLQPLAMMPGRFAAYGGSGRDWTTGWWQSTPIALGLDTHEGIRITIPNRTHIIQLAAAGRILATVSADGKGSAVRLYAIK